MASLFSEEEIRQELREMGYTPTRQLVMDLRRAIARADEDREGDENYDSTHPFASLGIQSQRPPLHETREGVRGMEKMEGGGVEQSPLVIRPARNPLRWEPQIPQAIDTITFAAPRLDGLMGVAYESVGAMYTRCDEVEDLKAELDRLAVEEGMACADGGEGREGEGRRDSEDSDVSTALDADDDEPTTEEERRRERGRGEERVERIRQRRRGGEERGRKSSDAGSDRGSTTNAGGGGSGVETLPGAAGLDAGLRPVLIPAPGRRPFRFDPVNRHAIYQQEWKRLPEPGAQKRLSLRWKIREQLLHRDMPVFDRNNEQNAMRVPPLAHPKDWSPRPYLD